MKKKTELHWKQDENHMQKIHKLSSNLSETLYSSLLVCCLHLDDPPIPDILSWLNEIFRSPSALFSVFGNYSH